MSPANNPNVFLFNCTVSETFSLLQNLEVPGEILKLCANILAYPVSHFVSSSLTNGIFQEYLKNAKFSPICKAGLKWIVENYRPLSVPPALSKNFDFAKFIRLSNYQKMKKCYTESSLVGSPNALQLTP